uniref:ISXO2-like transposase domain-containing protein n=1 Tax=Cuerna arida TaxID=1464854 RepID=A0A1B6ER10_9HEMI
MDLISFIKQTEGLENSINFAINHGLIPDKTPKKCLKCGLEGSLRWTKNSRTVNIPFMYVCSQRNCRSTISVSRNTLFDHLTFSLSQALRLIYFWLLKIPVQETACQLELAEGLVNVWFQFFREVCAFVIINYTKAIGGPGHIVDICEHQLLTKEEFYDVWLFAGVDRNTGQNFVIHVEDLDCETLLPVLKNYLLPGTVVVTEKCKEFTSNESNGSLTFVHPNKYPRSDEDYHLDGMWDALSKYIASEVPNNGKTCKELFAYQFLYFHRDGFFNKPVSQLISVFFDDVKHVYPGFSKSDNVQFKTRKIKV